LVIPQDQNKQASATTSGQIEKPPAAAPAATRESMETRLGSATPSSDEIMDAFERLKTMKRIAGVSDDPYADVKKRYENIEKRYEERRKNEDYEGLMRMLSAYGSAAPEKGGLMALGAAGEASINYRKEQQVLQDKQDLEMTKLYEAMAKEDDARKRGDLKSAESYLAQQKEHRAKIIDLEQKQGQVDAQMLNARANMIQAQRGPQPPAVPAEIQILERRMKDPEFNRQYEENKRREALERVRTEAIKKWLDDPGLQNKWKDKGGFQGFMNEYAGLYGVGVSAPSTGSPKEGDKATSRSGKPIIFRNGKWEYQ
jgi:hypothetical protein